MTHLPPPARHSTRPAWPRRCTGSPPPRRWPTQERRRSTRPGQRPSRSGSSSYPRSTLAPAGDGRLQAGAAPSRQLVSSQAAVTKDKPELGFGLGPRNGVRTGQPFRAGCEPVNRFGARAGTGTEAAWTACPGGQPRPPGSLAKRIAGHRSDRLPGIGPPCGWRYRLSSAAKNASAFRVLRRR
jgi:hypothetical protein